jgi:hypothetical protein
VRQRFVELTFEQLFEAHDEMGEPEALVELEDPAQLCGSLGRAAGCPQTLREPQAVEQIERVFVQGSRAFLGRFFRTADRQEVVQRKMPADLRWD